MPFCLISSLYDMRCFAGLALLEASASSRDVVNMRAGVCRPLLRVVPATASRSMDDGAKRDGAQLFGDALGIEAFGIGVVAKDLEMAGVVVEMRDCIFEKRAPLPGPCQAFAEKASGARMAGRG